MTLMDLVRDLNEVVGNDAVMAQKEINLDASIIVFDDNTTFTFEDDESEEIDDWGYNEDCGFDPYCGCYTDDC